MISVWRRPPLPICEHKEVMIAVKSAIRSSLSDGFVYDFDTAALLFKGVRR